MKMTRDEKVDRLVHDDFDRIRQGDMSDTLEHMLRYGTAGYSRYTDEEIEHEMTERELYGDEESDLGASCAN
jgi:hypothetical protein